MADEAHAVGINWSFTPVHRHQRRVPQRDRRDARLGSDVAAIERACLAQIAEFQKAGVAATVKHWPGEGYDDRDQHLVTTINPLSLEDWEETFGRLYRAAIEAGVLSVMAAHIALPGVRPLARSRRRASRPSGRPRSASVLNQTLLREKLGFNGLIVSDATGMAGLGAWATARATICPRSSPTAAT